MTTGRDTVRFWTVGADAILLALLVFAGTVRWWVRWEVDR